MKGQYKIQLIDKTGNIVQETTDNNMLTNAIANLLNPPPLFFAESTTCEYSNFMLGLIGSMESLMGGVILWSENIPEDSDMILPPNIEAQVGYAGNDAYTGTNALRGSYNALESGRTDAGYKFVFDFPTSAANGVIKCVTMTSAQGGKCGWGGDNTADIFRSVGISMHLPSGISGVNDYFMPGNLLGQWQKDTFVFGKAIGNDIVLTEVNFPINAITASSGSIFSSKISRNYKDDARTTIPVGYAANSGCWFSDNDKIVICTYASTTSIRYLKIDPQTKTIVENMTITTTGYSLYSGDFGTISRNPCVEIDGYLYLYSPQYYSTKILKINLSDTTQQEILTLPPHVSPDHSYGKIFVFGGKLAWRYGSSAAVRQNSVYLNSNGEWVDINILSLNQSSNRHQFLPTTDIKLPWRMYGDIGSSLYVYAGIFNAYLATINNLATPINKTADVSMKIICELTDV